MSQTLGQKLVGVSFNPSSLSEVDEAKQKSAGLIDQVKESMDNATSEEALMIHNEAIRRIMDAQMWAVKAITWKD
ncbi:hypothetical protein ABN363_00505 [Providencia rettgeri]|uniref:hypothetical protein n=1 Tax=Providencia TaxID=586 RepID=UPI001B392009|nr:MULTISPECIES: hypothetical protein [Providencia]MBQ0263466.1 hypothetical protein [Providencia rettgeri]MCB4853709.1 hypothetical protein [Providencia rettgeri]MCD6314395.1 hypothetical protein [Providencia rettgeri]MCS4542590.1 hypothetical protein [Providencia rettgeri]MDB9557933.1 hypothetical protein [Providencia rettgeri]